MGFFRFTISYHINNLVHYCIPLRPRQGCCTPFPAYGDSLDKMRQRFSRVQPLVCLHETTSAMCSAQPYRTVRQSELSRLSAAESSIPHRLLLFSYRRRGVGAQSASAFDEPHGRAKLFRFCHGKQPGVLARGRSRVAASRAKASFRPFSARQKRGRPPRRRYNERQGCLFHKKGKPK